MATETKIFVVDDDDAVRDSLKFLLEAYGMDVEAFASTEAFVRDYRPHERECLILDQHLQGDATGLDFLRSRARAGVRLPVILITGRGDEALKNSALQLGAAAYLDKPLDEGLLTATIDEVIAAARKKGADGV